LEYVPALLVPDSLERFCHPLSRYRVNRTGVRFVAAKSSAKNLACALSAQGSDVAAFEKHLTTPGHRLRITGPFITRKTLEFRTPCFTLANPKISRSQVGHDAMPLQHNSQRRAHLLQKHSKRHQNLARITFEVRRCAIFIRSTNSVVSH